MAKRKKPTAMQKKAVDNIMSGKFKSKGEAMRDAGYSEITSTMPKNNLLRLKGVQAYLKSFDQAAVMRFGMTVEEKVREVYLDGLEAEKPVGKHGEVIPDYKERRKYADRIGEMMGIVQKDERGSKKTVNFFMFDKEQRDDFNDAFNDFIRDKSSDS